MGIVGLIAVLLASMLDPLVAAGGIASFFIGRANNSWPIAWAAVFGFALAVTILVVSLAGGGMFIHPGFYLVREFIATSAWFGLTVLVVRSTNGQGITKA